MRAPRAASCKMFSSPGITTEIVTRIHWERTKQEIYIWIFGFIRHGSFRVFRETIFCNLVHIATQTAEQPYGYQFLGNDFEYLVQDVSAQNIIKLLLLSRFVISVQSHY